jgi:hypothetical protein
MLIFPGLQQFVIPQALPVHRKHGNLVDLYERLPLALGVLAKLPARMPYHSWQNV